MVRELGGKAEWKIVLTRELEGALRYRELSRKLGRPAPVPSIFINGGLVYDTTPDPEELKAYLDQLLSC